MSSKVVGNFVRPFFPIKRHKVKGWQISIGMVAVEISSEYAWVPFFDEQLFVLNWNLIFNQVLLTASIIAVQVIFQGFAIGGQRRKHFNKEFFKKNFKDIKESDIPQGGYPDMGNGKYADKLSLDAWRQYIFFCLVKLTSIDSSLSCQI